MPLQFPLALLPPLLRILLLLIALNAVGNFWLTSKAVWEIVEVIESGETFLAVIQCGGTISAVTRRAGKFSAVIKSGGIRLAVTKSGGTMSAVTKRAGKK